MRRMLSEPGAAMQDTRLFTSRLDGAFPDLYERRWDGDEWVWVDHGRPGRAIRGTPGAAMLGSKLFVTDEDGTLWERTRLAGTDDWVWSSHGRPDNRRIVSGPGAAMLDRKFFVVGDDGRLWERDWRADLGRWAWNDHGRTPGGSVGTAPGAAMMNGKLFVGGTDGHLWERVWTGAQWVWVDHGSPPGTRVSTAPGAAMMDRKLFVGTADGRLFERYWNGTQWVWVDHGRPPGTTVATTPGAAMQARRLFVGADDGRLFERAWDGTRWNWIDHGAPAGRRVVTAPGAAMMDGKLFVGAEDGHLYERAWSGTAWGWEDHGTPMHDQATMVIGTPGTDPKLTIAVIGDGYAEADLNAWRRQVDDQVLAALRLDAMAAHQGALRVIRIDLLSASSGVGERRYAADGSVASDTPHPSRLNIVPNDDWNRLWFDLPANLHSRVDKVRARFAPEADHVVILVKSATWGGMSSVGPGIGIFTEGGGRSMVAHEMGHNLFRLDDEYVNDDATGTFTGVSDRVNTSETLADWSTVKWASLLAPGAALPGDAAHPPAGWDANTSVGVFEGARGRFLHGIFRPVLHCRMNQNDPPWCPVCAGRIATDLAAFE